MKPIEPCVGCDQTTDALYCSYECAMDDDDARILESPITGALYYVTEWEDNGDGGYIAHEKRRIKTGDSE